MHSGTEMWDGRREEGKEVCAYGGYGWDGMGRVGGRAGGGFLCFCADMGGGGGGYLHC
jgi:hypothetical protein